MSVSRTSLSRCKSCYGIVGEVVCFECYITIVVGCGNCYKSITLNIPDSDGVNVLAIFKLVRNGNSYLTTLELGNNATFTIFHGEVVNGVIANLTESFV